MECKNCVEFKAKEIEVLLDDGIGACKVTGDIIYTDSPICHLFKKKELRKIIIEKCENCKHWVEIKEFYHNKIDMEGSGVCHNGDSVEYFELVVAEDKCKAFEAKEDL